MISEAKSSAPQISTELSDANILIRGCDPVMAQRASEFLPAMIGLREPQQMVSATDDADFFQKLADNKWDVVMFAPGACRWSAANQPIPGGNEKTKGWTLEEYRLAVRELQGEDVPIVETVAEKEIVPLLKAAIHKQQC